jgi:putative DNA primase/helicase
MTARESRRAGPRAETGPDENGTPTASAPPPSVPRGRDWLRNHCWLREDGSLAFVHYKVKSGGFRYCHPCTEARCPEHPDAKPPSRGWCYKEPAEAAGMLWDMPALAKTLANDGDVLWCAGEKDAIAVAAYLRRQRARNACATSVHQGETEQRPVTAQQIALFEDFAGKVILYLDRDTTGLKHALDRFRKLRAIRVNVVIKALPGELIAGEGEHNDISDHLAAGGDLAGLREVTEDELRAALEAASPNGTRRHTRRADAGDAGPAESAAGEEVTAKLAAFLKALRTANPEAQRHVSGGKTYWTCPLADELHSRGDQRPSFNVEPGRDGGLVLACSCAPGGGETGEPHTEWVERVLDKLGLDWDAVSPPGEVIQESKFLRNDTGNAELLRSLHGDDLAWVPEREKWFAWDGHCWAARPSVLNAMVGDMITARHAEAKALLDPKARQAAKFWAVSCGNDVKIKAMLRRLAEMEGMSRSAACFDRNPRLLAFANGTLELDDDGVEFREHRREDYITVMVPRNYKPEAKSRHWQQFLARFVPGKANREYLQQLAGYSLAGENDQRKLIFVAGPTSTGKTTLINVFMEALGKGTAGTFQLSMFRVKRDDAPRPDILKAMTRRMIFAEEASGDWKLNAEQVKAMTGKTTTEARGMRSNEFVERVPAFTPWIATNEAPEIRGADMATQKRLIGFPLREQVTLDDDDSDWITRLGSADYEAVLAWMVHGWALYREHGLEQMPEAVARETAELREAVSPLDQFIAERCEVDNFPKSERNENNKDCYRDFSTMLYDTFREWWIDSGRRPSDVLSSDQFKAALTAAGFGSGQPKWDKQNRKMARLRYGLRRRELGEEGP